MKRLIFLFVLLCSSLAMPTLADETTPNYIDYHFQEANRLRAEQGLAPFSYNEQLAEAANVQSDWMIRNWSYAHYHGGSSPTTRSIAAGYSDYDWCCTENTFLSPNITAEAAMNFWLNSPPHYRQLMSLDYDEIGVGFATGTERTGQVIVFGRRNPAGGESVPIATPSPPEASETSNTPPVEASSNTPGCSRTHTVETGQNLFRIGLRYGLSAAQLAAHNGITDITRIYVGQVLCIPSGSRDNVSIDTNNLPVNDDSGAIDNPQAIDESNWCYPGNIWGDGRCNQPADPAERLYLWQCGWYGAHGLEHADCNF